MADLTVDILTDRTTYPDDMKLVLPDGREITVKQFRDTTLPKSEFTKATQGWSQKEQEYKGNLDTAQQNLAATIAERDRLAAEAAAKGAARPTPGEDPLEVLRTDPLFGPYIKASEEKIADAVKRVEAHEERLKNHEATWMRTQYTQQLGMLGQHYQGRFNKDGKGKAWDPKEFLKFAESSAVFNREGMVDLGETYQRYIREDEATLLTREAEERGVERGKSAARVPPIPSGRRSVPRKPEGPQDVRDVKVEDVENDPEFQEHFAQLGL